jgi:threonine dehydrogenase-like Zn-dependent dehydrogenase
VFGAGPVGLLAAYSSMLRGAAEVYVVDGIAERLAKTEEIGAIAIDFTRGEPCKQIAKIRGGNGLVPGSLRPGEEKMSGVMCGIDAVRAKPSFIVSHRLKLDEAPAAYRKFDSRTDGYTKVVLKPEAATAG